MSHPSHTPAERTTVVDAAEVGYGLLRKLQFQPITARIFYPSASVLTIHTVPSRRHYIAITVLSRYLRISLIADHSHDYKASATITHPLASLQHDSIAL